MSSKVFAVFDLSSSSVGGAHALRREDGTIALLATLRMDAPVQDDMEITRFVENTVKHLESITTSIRKTDLHHPSHIQVVLASPWYTSQTRTIVYKKETPFVCTEKLVHELIEAELEHMITTTEGPFGEFGKESSVIEKQLSGITLNGYQTNNPYGKRAQSLELHLTVTIAPKPILDRFTDTLRRAYGTRKIAYTTSPTTTFVVLRDLSLVSGDCVVIDVGEEVTDVAFIKSGIPLYQHSFPVGTYGLYRTILTTGNHTSLETLATLESYRLGKLSEHTSKSIEEAISAYGAQWQAGFRSVLDMGTYGFCMPSRCIITADPRFETLLTTIIKTDPFIEHSCSFEPVQTSFVDQTLIGSKVTTSLDTPLDIPLATAALFAERVL